MPVPPWRITSVLSRAEEGPLIFERDFDRKVLMPNIKRVVKEYDLKFDPEIPIPSDDSLAKDVWRAGVDLLPLRWHLLHLDEQADALHG